MGIAARVVVAIVEELDDGRTVAAQISGEDFPPGLAHLQQLLLDAILRQVAANQHRVAFPPVEVAQRRLEMNGRVLRQVEMDVRQQTDAEVRLLHAFAGLGAGQTERRSQSQKRLARQRQRIFTR
ncbi:MAG: hypothetical protein Q4G65_19180 [bacterium]|nr:hypothetical protein [bacterium]